MECARCGADQEMLYTCRHCGRDYCSSHRYPRHGCVTPSDVGGEGEPEPPQASRRMDLDAPAPEGSDPAASLGEWLRRQTYPALVVKTTLLALLFSLSFYGGLLAVLFV